MSKPRKRWWGFVRRMIRDYPGLKNQLDDLHQQSVTPSLSGMPGGAAVSRSTEMAALRQLPDPDDQAAYDAVTAASERILLSHSGEEKLALVRLMYWRKSTMTITAAATALHVSPRTARRWHAQFIRLVAVAYGFHP